MRTKIAVISIVVALCGVLLGADRPLEELRAAAARAPINDQPKLYIAVAESQLKVVDGLYSNSDAEKGQIAIQQLASDCENAADASMKSRKHMKHTEIALRKIGERLDSIRKNAAYDDRAAIKEAIDRIEKVRSSLLDAMFSKK